MLGTLVFPCVQSPLINLRVVTPSQSKERMPVSTGHINVFIGIDGDSAELDLPTYNTWWFLKNGSINKMSEDYDNEPGPVPNIPFLFIGFPSAKVCHGSAAAM